MGFNCIPAGTEDCVLSTGLLTASPGPLFSRWLQSKPVGWTPANKKPTRHEQMRTRRGQCANKGVGGDDWHELVHGGDEQQDCR